MDTQRISIVGIGMVTAVGLSAAETAASVRAGVARFVETEFRDKRFNRFTLAEVPDDGLPSLQPPLLDRAGLTPREIRLLKLAALALRECVARAADLPVPLLLALPEYETTRPLAGEAFLALLAAQVGGVIDVARSDASHRGRAGGLRAMAHASEFIRGQHARFVVAGGVDTFRDPYVLSTLDRDHRVKSPVNLDGFIPGEGAAFVLLADPQVVRAAGLEPIAHLSRVGLGFEDGHLYSEKSNRGEGLANVLDDLLYSGTASGPIGDVLSSMNGESYWFKEWGASFIRHRAFFSSDYRMQHPADSVGDTGAACGPLMTGLAALGIRQRYRGSPSLVYCSSDWGARAATLVSAD
jgi:3-oxoacyl-[acyl-carrier-protein] synthase-1